MKTDNNILSDFEELIKARSFHEEGLQLELECTLEQINHALKNEYTENVDAKLNRWVDISIALYFQNVVPVKFYLQAKMLYRDGFYEAAITMSRSICEMICYQLLATHHHPFGTTSQIELENFRTLINFLAIPKAVEKLIFEKQLVNKVLENDDKNFVKSSFAYDKTDKHYHFKISNGKKAETLNKFLKICESVNFTLKDNFPNDSFKLINKVYDDGNTYVHARTSMKTAKEDARTSIFNIGAVLFELYGIRGLPVGQEIVSGYSGFPDICKGMGFAIDVYSTVEDAQRGYYNLPSTKQMDKMMTLVGHWQGECAMEDPDEGKGLLVFWTEGEYLHGKLISNGITYKPLGIKCFGNYFRLLAFDPKTQNLVGSFDFEWLNTYCIVGTCEQHGSRRPAVFTRTTGE